MPLKDFGEQVRVIGYVAEKKTGTGKASGQAYHVLTIGLGKASREFFVPSKDEEIMTLFYELVVGDEVICKAEYRDEGKGSYKPVLLKLARYTGQQSADGAGATRPLKAA